jgi:hypothetical protein
MRNPFLSESRDVVLSIGGLISKLRTSATLHRAMLGRKPAHLGLGDFANKAMYDAPLIAAILDGRYREVQSALEADWGPLDPNRGAPATDVAADHVRRAA